MLETGKSYARYFLDVFRHLRHPLFENRFVNQLRGDKRRDLVPRDFFRGLPDDYYYWLMTFSHNLGQQAGGLIPEIPPAHIQRTWTGSAGQTTFQQAFVFYQRVLKWVERYSEKPIEKLEVLDFGSGWGRIIRFFLRDVPHNQLHGTDCWQEIVESSRSLNRWCSFDINSTLPPMQYADQSFDLVYLYSVFSHLSEAAHLAWLGEFRRLLRPGGLLVTTTRPRRFLQILSASRDAHSSKGMYYSATAGEAFPDIQGTLRGMIGGNSVSARLVVVGP